MTQQVIVVGSGFAGMMSALSASGKRHEKGVSPNDLKITLVSPEPKLVIRPRLYERKPETMVASLSEVLAATGVEHFKGWVEKIDKDTGTIDVAVPGGATKTLHYDRLVLASGSVGFFPPIPGLTEHGFSCNDLEGAIKVDKHIHALAGKPDTPARNTIVVGGGGFTGIEVATEMPSRLREILGPKANIRVIIVERNPHVAPDMGDAPRPYIEETIKGLGVEMRLGSGIARVDQGSVTLDNGERIETNTTIWSAGMRASALTAQLPGEHDQFGRILVDPDERVPGAPHVFATGDTAKAATDTEGNFTVLSCQHAMRMGAFAGHNAVADLLGDATLPYDQPSYVTCLDLGPETAIFTRGWSPRIVEMTGDTAKKMKVDINTMWIYPPAANPETAYQTVNWFRTTDF